MTESTAPQPERYAFGKFSIDRTDRSVVPDGSTPDLTSAEFDLLWALVCHAGEVVSRDDLMLQLRGVEFDGASHDRRAHLEAAPQAARRREQPAADQDDPQQGLSIQQARVGMTRRSHDAVTFRAAFHRPGAEMIRRTRSHPDAPPLPTLRYVKWRWLHSAARGPTRAPTASRAGRAFTCAPASAWPRAADRARAGARALRRISPQVVWHAFDSLPGDIWIVLVFVFAAPALAAYRWMRPVWSDLVMVRERAIDFTGGRFNTRARESHSVIIGRSRGR